MSFISRPKIPDFKTKNELFSYLIKNQKSLIAQKRAFPIKSDDLEFGYNIIQSPHKSFSKKEDGAIEQVNSEDINVEVFANVAGWCDSQMDVLMQDCWKKSITETGASGQKVFYHLKNHSYRIDDVVGKDAYLFTRDINPSERFNIKTDVKRAQALMMASTLSREYDQKVFMLYRDGQIKQHSIGLQYVKLYLCVENSTEPDAAVFTENWEKYYPFVINKGKVNERGFFWAVTEIKVLETSTVLYGANELTPVESTNDTKSEPSRDTPEKSLKEKSINWDKLAGVLN